MLEIYMIRHGRTLFNEKDMVQGACDSPLTEVGRKQAQNVGKNMKNIPFTLAFSSPSERASDTCEAIIQNRLPIHLDKRLKEMNFGNLEGEKNSALFNKEIEDFDEVIRVGWVKEGGENESMVMDRIDSFFTDLISKYDNEIILLASHGMWLDFALKYFEKENYTFHALENCSVSKVIYKDGKFRIESIGDCSYRDKEESK